MAGDVISCRSFDNPLSLFKAGYLGSVKDLEAIKTSLHHAWSPGKRTTVRRRSACR